MTSENVTQPGPPAKKLVPRCPHCSARPCNVGVAFISFDRTSHAVMFLCGKCEKIISIAPLMPGPVQEPEIRRIIEFPGRM